VTAIPDVCADVAGWITLAALLVPEHDADGSQQPGSSSDSRPPWNAEAANACYDPAPFVRGLEASMRLAVTGHPGQARGGSDGNTRAALKAIESFAWPLRRVHENAPREIGANGRLRPCHCPYCRAGHHLARLARAVQQLPAIDEAERPQRVATACPYCGIPMMRLFPRAGLVVCLRGGFACQDGDGNPPKGHARSGRLGPQIEWEDGLVT
jgi:hypothetical protein